MATGTQGDMVIYDREFFGGLNEALQLNLNAFNEASGGCLRMVTRDVLGEFERESFMKRISNSVAHRDPTTQGTVADGKMEQGEFVGVKVNKRIGPTSMTIDSWKKIGETPEVFSFFYGQQTAEDVMKNYLDTAILVAQTTISTIPALVFDQTGEAESKLQTTSLLRGIRRFGDKASRIKAWVMHSAAWFDLVEHQTVEKITNVSDVVIYGGMPGTYNRPVIVTDSPSLYDDTDPNNLEYYVLGLTEDAVEVAQSEDETIWSQPITGHENLAVRIQGEYAYNVRAKGFAWGSTANPADSALGTGGNWSFVMHDNKLAPGVVVKVSESTVT